MINTESRLLRTLFSDIVRGFSVLKYKEETIFAKHFNSFDIADNDIIYNEYYKKALDLGVPTQEDRESFLLKEEIWTLKQESTLGEQKKFLNNLYENYSREFLKSKRQQWQNEIKEQEKKITLLEFEKRMLVGQTAESYATKRSNEFYIRKSLFKTDDLKTRYKDDEEFELMANETFSELMELYNTYFGQFSISNMKKISLSTFFLNMFSLCEDNPMIFYGKPIIGLTLQQIELFGHAVQFKRILGEFGDRIPKDVMEDPVALMDWVEVNRNANKVFGKDREVSGTMVVGATKEDLKALGMEPNQGFSLSSELKKKGKLSMEDLMKLHGE